MVDKDRNAVSFINSIFNSFGSAVVAGDTGIVLHNRGSGFSLEPGHPNQYAPGKRPFHTLIPAMVFRDGSLLMSYGVMGGDVQAQGHAQVLVNLIDRGLNLQQAIDAPRVRYISGRGVMMEDGLTAPVIADLVRRGHERVLPGPRADAPRADGRRSGDHDRSGDRCAIGRIRFPQGRLGARILTGLRTKNEELTTRKTRITGFTRISAD